MIFPWKFCKILKLFLPSKVKTGYAPVTQPKIARRPKYIGTSAAGYELSISGSISAPNVMIVNAEITLYSINVSIKATRVI